MSLNLKIMVILFSVLLTVLLVYLLKKKKIPVKYALVWLFTAFIILIVTFIPNLMEQLANILGFELLSNMLLCLFIAILLFITLVLTVMISNQKRKVVLLIQEVSILKKELEDKK